MAGHLKTRIRVSDNEARTESEHVRREWLAEIQGRASEQPNQHFRNMPRSVFERRLHAAAARYGFKVKSVTFYRPRQLAPSVIVEARRYLRFAHALPTIDRSLDPYAGTWAYEGFYLEAQDERGIPFVIVSNAVRGRGPGGGQWARSEELFPFPHG